MKPATGFLLSALMWVGALTALALIAVQWQSQRTAQGQWKERLHTAAAVGMELQAIRLQELQLRAAMLANDQAFVDYVAQSLIPSPALGGAVDSASISDLLNERRHGYDLAMVLDPRGQPVASSGVLLRDRAGIRRDPLVARAIAGLKPVQGLWIDHGQLLWVAVNPLLRGGVLQGVLLSGAWIGDEFAATASRMGHTGIALVATGAAWSPRMSGTGEVSAAALGDNVAGITAVIAPTGQALQLRVDQHGASAWVVPLPVSGGRAALVAVAPAGAVTATARGLARPLQLGAALLGLLAALLVLQQWWRTYLPLQRMQSVVHRAANGDAHLTVRVDGGASVRQLREQLNRLLQRT